MSLLLNRHLRNLRGKLLARMERGLTLIERHFPAGCKVTKPSGGFSGLLPCSMKNWRCFGSTRTII